MSLGSVLTSLSTVEREFECLHEKFGHLVAGDDAARAVLVRSAPGDHTDPPEKVDVLAECVRERNVRKVHLGARRIAGVSGLVVAVGQGNRGIASRRDLRARHERRQFEPGDRFHRAVGIRSATFHDVLGYQIMSVPAEGIRRRHVSEERRAPGLAVEVLAVGPARRGNVGFSPREGLGEEDGQLGACQRATRAVVLQGAPRRNAVVEESFDRSIEEMRPGDVGEAVPDVNLPARSG